MMLLPKYQVVASLVPELTRQARWMNKLALPLKASPVGPSIKVDTRQCFAHQHCAVEGAQAKPTDYTSIGSAAYIAHDRGSPLS